jgi:hypothetical protein
MEATHFRKPGVGEFSGVKVINLEASAGVAAFATACIECEDSNQKRQVICRLASDSQTDRHT